MNNISNIIINALILALIGGVGYYLKNILASIQQIRDELGHTNEKLQHIALDVADMKPKVDALWQSFLKIKNI